MKAHTELFENVKAVQAFAPSADLNNTDPASDAIRLALYRVAHFLMHTVATTGTAVVTVEACSAADGTGAEAIAFYKRFLDAGGSPVDSMGAEAAVAATGFTTTVSKTGLYVLRVDPADLPAGKPFVRVQLTEGVDAAVIGSALWLLTGGRYGAESLPSAVS